MSVPLSTEPLATAAVPSSMSAVTMERYGGTERLTVREVRVPDVGRAEVLVRVAASSVNPIDWHFLTGTPYLARLGNGLVRPRRRVLGVDVAGTVVAVGAGVTDLRLGDAVLGYSRGGAFADHVAVAATDVVRVPAGVDLAAAAATPLAGLTALQGLRTHGRLAAGDRVLVIGAAGGVGTFAVQIARILGARHVTAVCSARNADQARALGATDVVDYATTDVTALGRHYDVVLDMVGGHSAAELLRVLAPGARYVAVSGPKANRWFGPVPHLLRTAVGLARSGRTFHQFTAAPRTEDLRFLAQELASGRLVPAVDRQVGLGGVAAALDEIAGGHARAKIVVRPGLTTDALADGRDAR